jgi:hypothetical protein
MSKKEKFVFPLKIKFCILNGTSGRVVRLHGKTELAQSAQANGSKVGKKFKSDFVQTEGEEMRSTFLNTILSAFEEEIRSSYLR